MTLAQAENGNSRGVERYQAEGDAAQLIVRLGGATLVAELLRAASSQHGFHVLGPELQPKSMIHASSIVDLEREGAFGAYNVVKQRRIGKPSSWNAPLLDQAAASPGPTVIITGSGEKFKSIEPALDFLSKSRARYLIYHMTCPLASGPLWDLIRDGPRTRDGVPEPDFLAVIVDADDLRKEGIALSQSLSWEASAEDFVRNLGSNGSLDTLVTCPNLIVRFGDAGYIHHRGRDAVDPRLYYHPRRIEREPRHNQMIGLANAFTAGFAMGFADSKPPDCVKGMRLGISAANKLAKMGFVDSDIDKHPDFPVKEVMADITPDKEFVSVSIPSGMISSGDRWSIFDTVTGETGELARKIVTQGPEYALRNCPTSRFAKLLCVERNEQESVRAVLGAVQERLEAKTPQPTSIGIMGPLGAGKKFTATNLASHISDDRPVQQLKYNARLLKPEDLIQACHAIRDAVATGMLTIVLFENFEAVLETNSTLLNDFLAIMRDGKFSDRGHVRSLGAPLMFFIINQEESNLMGPLTPMTPGPGDLKIKPPIDEALLLDHLHGVVHVKGPNQTSADDKIFPVRRALILRSLLVEKHRHLVNNGKIDVEEGVLHALLLVPSYKHGLRSLEKIIATSRLSSHRSFGVRCLPPEEQIQLYVDGRIFMSYLRSPKLPPALREKLAEGLFATYKKQKILMCKTDHEREMLESDRSMRDWDELAPELKESTRAQADDIPRKLRAIDCFMLQEDRGDPLELVPEFDGPDLDMLSEMEHERFNAERLQRQWKMGPRNSKQRTTPFLVPWRDLTQEWKDVDKVMVECVPRILATAGFKIYRMKGEA
nr:hypothetical protein CFP56_73789 [Quercus suber]